ncbi:MAG: hypothetical protein HHAS10_05950 [Candidatus Altimarinota bacterium]
MNNIKISKLIHQKVFSFLETHSKKNIIPLVNIT